MANSVTLAPPTLSLPRKGGGDVLARSHFLSTSPLAGEAGRGESARLPVRCLPPPSIPPHKGEGSDGARSDQQVSLPLVGREQGWGDSPTKDARHG